MTNEQLAALLMHIRRRVRNAYSLAEDPGQWHELRKALDSLASDLNEQEGHLLGVERMTET